MEIKFTGRFDCELQEIYNFIAKDSVKRADDFVAKIEKKLMILSSFPYMGVEKRANIREFIYEGYIIPYGIYDDVIYLLGIYKQNLWWK